MWDNALAQSKTGKQSLIWHLIVLAAYFKPNLSIYCVHTVVHIICKHVSDLFILTLNSLMTAFG